MIAGCLLAFAAWAWAGTAMADPSVGKIVGLGATDCARFTEELAALKGAEREYIAWAQGFMSAILMTRPTGIDEGLNLSPEQMPLSSQVAFLKQQCESAPDRSFSEAVEALYRRLREIGKRGS